MTHFTKRAILAATAALALSGTAMAQEFPNKPITMIVPFAAGGPTDIIARIVGESMSRTLGQQVVIENVAGAGGTTGITRAAKAAPDGYTIMMGHMGTHGAAPGMYPNLAYDPQRISSRSASPPARRSSSSPRRTSGEGPEGVRGLREGERSEGEPGACRPRLGLAHHLRAAAVAARHQDERDPLPRHRPGHERPRRRHGRFHVRPDRLGGAAGPGRHDQGLRRRHAEPQSRDPERADHRRGGHAGLPGLRLERRLRAQGHPGRRGGEALERADDRRDGRHLAQAPDGSRRRRAGRRRRLPRRPCGLVKRENERWIPLLKSAGVVAN